MRVVSKSDEPISAFEVYKIVSEELSKIPVGSNRLSDDQLREKFCYSSVLEQIGKHSCIPSIESLNLSTERISALQSHGVQLTSSIIISKDHLDALLSRLHRYVVRPALRVFCLDISSQ